MAYADYNDFEDIYNKGFHDGYHKAMCEQDVARLSVTISWPADYRHDETAESYQRYEYCVHAASATQDHPRLVCTFNQYGASDTVFETLDEFLYDFLAVPLDQVPGLHADIVAFDMDGRIEIRIEAGKTTCSREQRHMEPCAPSDIGLHLGHRNDEPTR